MCALEGGGGVTVNMSNHKSHSGVLEVFEDFHKIGHLKEQTGFGCLFLELNEEVGIIVVKLGW